MIYEVAEAIHRKYLEAYDGDTQGCCLLIADEIQKEIGGEVVAGYLCLNGGRRSHWWVVKDDRIIDPMGLKIQSHGDHVEWVEEHRNRETFEAILPEYECWRIL